MPTQTLYPHTIDVHRSKTVVDALPNIGQLSYSGMSQGYVSTTMGENVIVKGILSYIQPKGMGKVRGNNLLPGDSPGPAQWEINIPSGQVTPGTIKDRDILVDQDGYRYHVAQASWHSLGWQLIGIRLES